VQLNRLTYEIFVAYAKPITATKYSIQQFAQIYQNALIMQESCGFFKKYLEKMTNNRYAQESEAGSYFEQIKYTCTELVDVEARNKISTYMTQYENWDWTPKSSNPKYSDCVEDLMNFLLSVFTTLKQINFEIVPSLAYLSFKHINFTLLNLFQNHVKEFNMLGVMNLEFDVAYMFLMCNTVFKEYENLKECLREIRQFLDLFVTGHVHDLLNPQERKSKYYAINLHHIIPILEKYKKKKVVSNKVPFLKRSQVKEVVSKLKKELKLK